MGGKCASFLLEYAEINDTTVGCKKKGTIADSPFEI